MLEGRRGHVGEALEEVDLVGRELPGHLAPHDEYAEDLIARTDHDAGRSADLRRHRHVDSVRTVQITDHHRAAGSQDVGTEAAIVGQQDPARRAPVVDPGSGAHPQSPIGEPFLDDGHVEVQDPPRGIDDLDEQSVERVGRERHLPDARQLGVHLGPRRQLDLDGGTSQAGIDFGLAVGDRLQRERRLVGQPLEQVRPLRVVDPGLEQAGEEDRHHVEPAVQSHRTGAATGTGDRPGLAVEQDRSDQRPAGGRPHRARIQPGGGRCRSVGHDPEAVLGGVVSNGDARDVEVTLLGQRPREGDEDLVAAGGPQHRGSGGGEGRVEARIEQCPARRSACGPHADLPLKPRFSVLCRQTFGSA